MGKKNSQLEQVHGLTCEPDIDEKDQEGWCNDWDKGSIGNKNNVSF